MSYKNELLRRTVLSLTFTVVWLAPAFYWQMVGLAFFTWAPAMYLALYLDGAKAASTGIAAVLVVTLCTTGLHAQTTPTYASYTDSTLVGLVGNYKYIEQYSDSKWSEEKEYARTILFVDFIKNDVTIVGIKDGDTKTMQIVDFEYFSENSDEESEAWVVTIASRKDPEFLIELRFTEYGVLMSMQDDPGVMYIFSTPNI